MSFFFLVWDSEGLKLQILSCCTRNRKVSSRPTTYFEAKLSCRCMNCLQFVCLLLCVHISRRFSTIFRSLEHFFFFILLLFVSLRFTLHKNITLKQVCPLCFKLYGESPCEKKCFGRQGKLTCV